MKNMYRILLMVAALVLALSMSMTAMAEEIAPEGEEAAASTIAYIFWQDQDWWPAVWSQADDYWTPTPATVTGEGWYTVKVDAHMPSWFYSGGNSNIGAQKLAIVVKDGQDLFPGMYMQIVDVRVDGVSYPCGDVTYGQTGYDNINNDEGGKVYWDANDTYALLWDQWMIDNGGSVETGATWNSAGEAQKFDVFDVSVLNNPKSIEIDFFLSAQQDVKPEGGPALRVLGEGPDTFTTNAVPSNYVEEVSTNAYIFWQDQDWWPAVTDTHNDYWTPTTATVTGPGFYTVGVQGHMPSWFYPGNSNIGAQKLAVVVDGGSSLFPGLYMNITDVRIDGVSHEVGDVTYGRTWYDNINDDGTVFWTNDDTYGLMYDQYQIDNNGTIDGTTWDSAAASQNFNIFDVSKLNNPGSIEIDFFLSETQDEEPAPEEEFVPEYEFTWYPNNTMGVAGYSLRDLGITDKWYNVCPVNLSKDGIYQIPLIASNKVKIGNATVTVHGDDVTVDYSTYYASPNRLTMNSECVKWFKSIDEITADFCAAPTSEIAFGDTVSKAELGDVAYLFICNGVTYSQPITDDGVCLPIYHSTHPDWKAYRANLDAMVAELAPAAEEAPAEEVAEEAPAEEVVEEVPAAEEVVEEVPAE
ncbi:MAG: hypothetical protein IJN44_11390 [Clostridia bacterium]|nr:hypothetical protein [Clostridia bacterium]